MARDIDELLPQVQTYARSCPEPVAYRFIREIARELCDAAKLWRERDQFEVRTPDCEALCSIQDAEIVAVEWAKLDNAELEPVTVEWLDNEDHDWMDRADGSPARFITQLNPNTVTVVPKASGLLKARYLLQPSLNALTLPDFLVDKYGMEIGRGAAGRILLLPNTEYTNPQLGAALVTEFTTLRDRIAIKAVKGQQKAPLRTKGRYF